MSGLMPEQRRDKNGNFVTCWINSIPTKKKSVAALEISLDRAIEYETARRREYYETVRQFEREERVFRVIKEAGQQSNPALEELINSNKYPLNKVLEVVTTYRTSNAEQIKVILDGGPTLMSEGIL